uniref:Dishevelled segment polarity protein 3b n=1 Tax=Oncorhynchus tshawytscha TaxID=74940 RepID=A0AAZ3SEH1_ONCTS
MGETKIIYHLDDQETPYLVKLPIAADRVTLADFKNALNKPNYTFFFKSMDDDFGVVKEEISDDNAKLPCFNGRVVSWLVSADGSHGGSDGGSVCADSQAELPPPLERTGGIGDSRPPSFQSVSAKCVSVYVCAKDSLFKEGFICILHSGYWFTSEAKDSIFKEGFICILHSGYWFTSEAKNSPFRGIHMYPSLWLLVYICREGILCFVQHSFFLLSLLFLPPPPSLHAEKYNFLGISIVGQSNEKGDGGIYIGSIMKGGAVAADGRIEPGDMLLQVNDINFENMSNDDAVRVLREIVHKPGPITLTVAKCWDPNPRGCFTLPRSEPIRPIDPAAWVSHTAAMTGAYPVYGLDDFHLSIHSDMATIAKAMANPESGLEVRDRMWLKITIHSAFIGSDVVDWLYHHMEGFTDRREARKYASNLLKAGYIRHTVNKITFSEQCYYIFGDLCGNMANLSLGDHDWSSGASDQDTLAPLPHPGAAPWPLAFPYQYPIPQPYNPHPLHEPPQSQPGRGGSAGSQHSEESRSSGSNCSGSKKEEAAGGAGAGAGGGESNDRSVAVPPNEHSMHSLISLAHSVQSTHSHSGSLVYRPPGLPAQPPPSLPITAPPGSPPGRDLASVPPELTASRQSFCMAMGNPSEFFVDVM